MSIETQVNIEQLEELMRVKKWSCAELARQIGVDASYLWRVLNGHKPGGGKLILGILALCQREGLDPDQFILLPAGTAAATGRAS